MKIIIPTAFLRLPAAVWRIPAGIVLVLLALFLLPNVSPIYDFQPPHPFWGSLIYNPYEGYADSLGWHRANLHTHTHARKWINECELYADSVLEYYRRYGYDIVTFSNHMEITEYPGDPALQVDVYEHGYNVAKLHNLTFAPKAVSYFDCTLPVLPSQMQYKMDRLLDGADFIFLNHPDRTFFIGDEAMQKLTGYRCVEADCGFADKDTYGHKWDVALSAGHYVPSAIGDDLHKPRKSGKIARRCVFFNVPSGEYRYLRQALLTGNFYTMHLPDFGEGDLKVKEEANRHLPAVTALGMRDSQTPQMRLSSKAARVTAIGQDGKILKEAADTAALDYTMRPADTYVRFVARFADGVVIFSNPFARWEGDTVSGTPYVTAPHPVNWWQTVLFNALLLGGVVLCLYGAFRLFCCRRCGGNVRRRNVSR